MVVNHDSSHFGFVLRMGGGYYTFTKLTLNLGKNGLATNPNLIRKAVTWVQSSLHGQTNSIEDKWRVVGHGRIALWFWF